MDSMYKYPIGALANLFPDMDGDAFARLVRNIREEGLVEPIAVWRGQVVDGRHRYRACLEAGVEPRFEHLPDDTDPMPFVTARNILRRHLSASQLAVITYRLTELPPCHAGTDSGCAILHKPMTQRQAADLFGVSLRSLHHARSVLEADGTAVPELRQAVEVGTVTVSDATRIVKEPPGVQKAALERVLDGSSKTVAGAAKQIAMEAARVESPVSGPGPSKHQPLFHQCSVAGLHELVEAGSVDAIITHPPLDEEMLPLYSDLAAFAVHALKETGVLVVMVDGLLLPRIMDNLNHHDMTWVCEFDCQFNWPQHVRHPLHRLTLHRRPVLVYAKRGFRFSGGDVIRLPSPGDSAGETVLLKGFDAAMALVVERFAHSGQVVCDPFLLGRGGTAFGAITKGCRFIGAAPHRSVIQTTRDILAKAGVTVGGGHSGFPDHS